MNKPSIANDQSTNVILDIIKMQNPQTTEELIKIARENTDLSEQEIADIILQLERNNKLLFADKEAVPEADSAFVVFSKKTAWFWVTVCLAITTTAIVFIVPGDLYPIVYIRQILGLIFVLFLPGYTFTRTLFPYSVPFKTSSENLDKIERIALGLGLSLALTPIDGLFLYYTSLGLGVVSITLSLFVLTLIFGLAAVAREYQTVSKNSMILVTDVNAKN